MEILEKNMRLKYLCLLLVLCIQFSFYASLSAKESKDDLFPNLSVDSVLYNVGEVNRGEIISHFFVLKNLGKADLVIKETHPD